MRPIYLDNAASTPINDEVLKEFNEVARRIYANPSSMHTAGIEAYSVIENVKELISKKINCNEEEVFFTSGATMSNNVLIQGVLRKHPETVFITSTVEHNDIMELYDWLPYSKHMLSVNSDGIIDTDELSRLVIDCVRRGIPCLVSIQMANSETGIIQPTQKISEIVHCYKGGFLHVDATQYLPYFSIDIEKMGIDSLSMSGQKIGGIKGSGLLYVRNELQEYTAPIIFGEQGLIGGTPSIPLIASLGKAFELLEYDNDELYKKRDYLINNIEGLEGVLIGTKENRLPNNVYVRFPGVNGMTLLNLLNEQRIYIGTGSACSTDSDKPSHVALAYGLTEEEAFECVRFTIGKDVKFNELNITIDTLSRLLCLLK